MLPLTPTPKSAAAPRPLVTAEPSPPALPALTTSTLANGMRLIVLERHLWPHASIGFLTTRGGEDGAALEASGLPSVVSQLVLSAGTSGPDDGPAEKSPDTPSNEEAEPESDSIWINFSELTFQHGAGLSTRVARDEVEPALEAIADHVQRLELDEAALLRARRSVASDLSGLRDTIPGIARNHVMQRLYGPSHTLGQHAKMAMERADKHDLSAVVTGYKARYVPKASVLIVAGDVDPARVLASVESLFGAWQADAAAPASYAPPTWQPQGKRKVFLHTVSRQAVIALGQRAPAVGSSDYLPFRALVHILAGSASSRLSLALRAEQGATYHVSGSLPTRKDGSTLLIETTTARDASEAAVARIVSEMARLQRDLVSEIELRRAKLALIDEIALSFATDDSAMLSIARLLSLGREPDAPQSDLEAVLALTPEKLREVAARTLQPTSAPIIVIGDLNDYSKLGQWAASDDEMLP